MNKKQPSPPVACVQGFRTGEFLYISKLNSEKNAFYFIFCDNFMHWLGMFRNN